MNNEIQLQPLRIPPGWNVKFNTLYNIDPEICLDEEELKDLLHEDMLLLESTISNNAVDVGWSGGISEGKYIITVVENQNWEKPLFKANAKSIKKTTKIIEDCLLEYLR